MAQIARLERYEDGQSIYAHIHVSGTQNRFIDVYGNTADIDPIINNGGVGQSATVLVKRQFGPTNRRPTYRDVERGYYSDTDINKPVWWNGTEWVVIAPEVAAEVGSLGLVRKSTPVSNVVASNPTTVSNSTASDIPGLVTDLNSMITQYNTMVNLVAILKSTLNDKLEADRNSDQQEE